MSEIIQRGGMKLILGFGLSGQSLARYCLRKSMPFQIADTRYEVPSLSAFQTSQQSEGYPISVTLGVALEDVLSNEADTVAFLSQFSEIYVSPGVSLEHPLLVKASELGIPLKNDMSLFIGEVKHGFPEVKVVAITGSNGKSTVTDWAAFVGQQLGYRCHAVGNIGLPVLDMLPELQAQDIVVIELSSYQLELVHNLGADIAVLLNVSDDHLDRHGTLQAYWRAKQKVYEKARVVLVNKDDPLSSPLEPHMESSFLKGYSRFGLGAPDLKDFGVVVRGGEKWFAKGVQPLQPVSLCYLKGEHNIANALVVLAICDSFGWSLDAACKAMNQYQGLLYRCQIERTQDGITWINDSKGTNVGASLVALRLGETTLPDTGGGLWWIAGGLAKGAQFAPIAQHIKSIQAKGIFKSAMLYGQDSEKIRIALEQKNVSDYHLVQSLNEAVQFIRAQAVTGDVVVFSPACASMDQFANFEARGQVFSEAVAFQNKSHF